MELTDDLKIARRKLESIEGYELLEDLFWDFEKKKWVLKFRITGDYNATTYVPIITDWYCIIPATYPFGKIAIFPDAQNGITYTFPHQSYNYAVDGTKWREGNICVDTSLGIWGRKFFNTEPFDVSKRLYWHICRCKDWIKAAANNTLVSTGDPFEMPSIPLKKLKLFVFNEDERTFKEWVKATYKAGIVYSKNAFNTTVFPITHFEAGNFKLEYDWGTYIKKTKSDLNVDLWVLLNSIPVVHPWQMPKNWNELFTVINLQGINLKSILRNEIFRSTSGPGFKHLLLGFPLPKNIGEPDCCYFWISLSLPTIPNVKGFRKDAKQMKDVQFAQMFNPNPPIEWLGTENWNKNEITSRGKLKNTISSLRFCIIGSGAIGSLFSELLLRLGCDDITLMDKDHVMIGNLSRHNLTMNKVWSEKAVAVAERLNLIFPHAKVTAIKKAFDNTYSQVSLDKLIEDTDIFVDATGEDSVIHFINNVLLKKNKKFISISIGFEANRLFCFMKNTENGSISEEFNQKLEPWLKKEADENPNPEFPRDGIGCWHNVFPARIDDISMLLSPAISRIEHFLNSNSNLDFIVIEKNKDESGLLKGINIIEN